MKKAIVTIVTLVVTSVTLAQDGPNRAEGGAAGGGPTSIVDTLTNDATMQGNTFWTGRINVNTSGLVYTNTGVSYGDGDTGWLEEADDTMVMTLGNTRTWVAFGTSWQASAADGARFLSSGSGRTVPVIIARRTDTDTGLGSGSNGELSITVDATERIRLTSSVVSENTTSLTLGAGVTTFAITSNNMVITGDGGANTIATITGAPAGRGTTVHFLFVDGNITISNDDTHAADTIDLLGASNFSSVDDTSLTLWYDGTSWYERHRSGN